MLKYKAQGIVEIGLILLLVVTVVFIAARTLRGNDTKWAGLSNIKTTESSYATRNGVGAADKQLQSVSTSNNPNAGVSTAGVLGQKITAQNDDKDKDKDKSTQTPVASTVKTSSEPPPDPE